MFIPLRDDAPRPRFPWATVTLVALNVAVFVIQRMLPGDDGTALLYRGGAIPWEVARFTDLVDGSLHGPDLAPPPLTILTSLFLHGSVEHLVGNVWFLWIFGDNVEAEMGAWRFTAFYLAVGILAAVVQVGATPDSQIPMVGASGAIAGVLGAYILLHPRARVQLLLFLVFIVHIVVVPAFVALGIWFVWQLMGNYRDISVATFAHVGGFVIGVALCKLFTRGRRDLEVAAPPWSPPWTLSAAERSSSPR